jgi:hypothetical protein
MKGERLKLHPNEHGEGASRAVSQSIHGDRVRGGVLHVTFFLYRAHVLAPNFFVQRRRLGTRFPTPHLGHEKRYAECPSVLCAYLACLERIIQLWLG